MLLRCEDADRVITVWCSENATWIPDLTELVCSPSFSTLTSNHMHVLRDSLVLQNNIACRLTINTELGMYKAKIILYLLFMGIDLHSYSVIAISYIKFYCFIFSMHP